MKKVLFVGEHPYGSTGNSGFLLSVLDDLNYENFKATVFAIETSRVDTQGMLEHQLPITIINSLDLTDNSEDRFWGVTKLQQLVSNSFFDVILFVGLDIWRYACLYPYFSQIRKHQCNKYIALFPYDLQMVRNDWIKWINFFDLPCVYSKYGYDLLKEHCPNLEYFRPKPRLAKLFTPIDEHKRYELKSSIIPNCKPDTVVFGFVGKNQIRKSPQEHILAFSYVKEVFPDKDVRLYMHTNFDDGIYNLKQYAIDCNLKTGDMVGKSPKYELTAGMMPNVYHSMDVLVNCSMQEGLSWTPIEAGLCGVPVILSESTAHLDYDFGLNVVCQKPTHIPLMTENGSSWVDALACTPDEISSAMMVLLDIKEREKYAKQALIGARSWLLGCSDINEFLKKATCLPVKIQKKIERVIFIQRGSAGDVFMTTRCFKGLSNRYNLPIDYMTDQRFINIVEGNPYIEKVLPWSEKAQEDAYDNYRFILNPHNEIILPGHWGRNSNSLLSDFYWKILRVEPDSFFIPFKKYDIPCSKELLPICIVHTTGGDPVFRTYKYMADVCKGLAGRYTTIQVGGKNDYPAGAEIDLRGKLSFQESAYVVSQASIAVTVDSFIAHLCGALGISQVCLFGSGNANVVRPNQMKGTLICMCPDYINHCPGLGPCSAVVRDCPVKCTGRHNPQTILKHISALEKEAA